MYSWMYGSRRCVSLHVEVPACPSESMAAPCVVAPCGARSSGSSGHWNPNCTFLPDTGMLQCVAMCCSVLQCVAVSCNVLQCLAMCCSVLQCVAVCCNVLQCVAMCCSVLQCVAVCCNVLQCVAMCCNRDAPYFCERALYFTHKHLILYCLFRKI